MDVDWAGRARTLAERFAERAGRYDREGSFPFENFDELRAEGFYGLTVPRRFGGAEAPIGVYLDVLGAIGRGCGSTALAFMMHLKTFGQEREAPSYPEGWFAHLCGGAVERGELVNTVATEEGLGSPSGGGVPDTVAKREGDGWVVSGRKTFTTLAPALHNFIVLARIEDGRMGGRARVGNFLIFRGEPGLQVVETWDALGMRATGSHDVVLEQVRLPGDRLLNEREAGSPDPRAGAGLAWFALGLCAVTIGVASAARDYAVEFARERAPNSQGPIREMPGVRARVARMDVLLQRSRALMGDAARAWETREAGGMPPIDRVAVAKMETLNACIEAVELAMRVVGGVSLQRARPMERYFRDVRAALHNPPLEDRALEQLARRALDGTFDPPRAAE
jgi:alkylation response protein AidB-like acyl-CoA dehydrogenase